MSKKADNLDRPTRADAARNYQHLLEVAEQAFAERGDAVRLEEIARAAGVGIGTLYRHFPTREVLVQAVYRKEMEQLATEAEPLLKRHSPAEALRRWLHRFVEYLEAKRLLAETLHMPVNTDALRKASGTKMGAAIAMLVQEGVDAGEIVSPVEPGDLFRALTGVATIYPGEHWAKNAKLLADVMVAGMCLPAQTSATQ